MWQRLFLLSRLAAALELSYRGAGRVVKVSRRTAAAGGEAWLLEAFRAPAVSADLARRIMEQMEIRLEAERLTDLVDRLILTASPAGISRVAYRPGAGAAAAPPAGGRVGTLVDQARREIAEYLAGERTYFTVPVDLSKVPAFDRAALDIAAKIPYGEIRSYKWIAEQLGKPDAARAVGGAMAGNPVPLILPCHRVVKTDGGLGGYSFGLVRKEALLDLERSTTPPRGLRLNEDLLPPGLRSGASDPRGRPDPFRLSRRRDRERVPALPDLPPCLIHFWQAMRVLAECSAD